MTAGAQPLEYAPKQKLLRRRGFRRIVLLCLLLGLIYPGWRYGPWAWKRGLLLYRQNRCLTYAPPADQVVYESAQAPANELLKRPGYVPLPIIDPQSYGNPGPVAAYVPPALRDLERSIGGPLANGSAAVLFMGELRAKNGMRRLVLVQRGSMNFSPFLEPLDLILTVFQPATLRQDLWVVTSPRALPLVWNGPVTMLPLKDLRFFAGRRDQADPARLTIRYQMGGAQGIIEGRLSDDATEVKIEIKSGPALFSTWASPPAAFR